MPQQVLGFKFPAGDGMEMLTSLNFGCIIFIGCFDLSWIIHLFRWQVIGRNRNIVFLICFIFFVRISVAINANGNNNWISRPWATDNVS